MSELTPMLRQYMEIKNQYPDYILFYRLGDFFEMFYEDAEKASKILGIALTRRNAGGGKKAPLCGVPFHSADNYLAKLVKAGCKVAICEQVEDPKESKGLVKREVTKLITPGTVTDPDMINAKMNSYLASIAEDDDNLALSYSDISTGLCKLKLFDLDDVDSLIDTLYLIQAKEILISDEYSIFPDVENFCATVNFDSSITKKQKKKSLLSFSLDNVKRFFNVASLSAFGVDEDSISSVESLSSLLEYIETTQKTDLKHIKNIIVDYGKSKMHLDSFTVRNLELLESMRTSEKKGSLLWVLDRTKSAMGARLLREWICEPLLEIEEINKRLDVLSYFKHEILIRRQIRDLLNEVYDFERILSKAILGSLNPRDILALVSSFKVLPEISILINGENLSSNYFNDSFDTLEDLCKLIDSAINEEAPASLRHGGFIKDNYNSELDELRDLIYHVEDKIAEIENEERENTGIKNLKVSYNKVFGYYVEVSKISSSKVPDYYIRKQTLVNSERYILPKLKDLENKILGAKDKALALEFELFNELRLKIVDNSDRISAMSNKIAAIDVLSNFAHISERNNYVRPILNHNNKSEIKDGRHPVVESIENSDDFVPNDMNLGNEYGTCMIITGPNMAGKSTYLRQVAIIHLMAQIGCFVPASYADLGLTDRIFTRVGASDDLYRAQSTFMVEMLELSNILNHASDKSLIILDEVGRGTATYDGLSIAWSAAEYIAKNLGARALYATHYHEMSELEKIVPGIVNYRIVAKEKNDKIIFIRKLERGSANKSFGVQVAKLAGMPNSVIIRAKQILKKLESSDIVSPVIPVCDGDELIGSENIENFQNDDFRNGFSKDELDASILEKYFELIARIDEIDVNKLSPIEALLELEKLKKITIE